MAIVCLCNTAFAEESFSGAAGVDAAPTNFLRQISLADHIIVSNWTADASSPEYERFTLDIRGAEMKGLVTALSELKNHIEPNTIPTSASAICAWQLQFYRGTNCLTTANFQGRLIRCGGGEYSDSTGTLDSLSNKIWRREHYEQYYKDEDKEFTAASKVEAKQWLKSAGHSVKPADKKKIIEFVEVFYASGALKVFLTDLKTAQAKSGTSVETATTLIVVLPKDPDVRKQIFSYAEKQAGTWTNEQDSDVGQKYLWLPFD